MTTYFEILQNFRFNFNDWTFTDFRLDIPPLSLGSDASNPHTQYSNPIAEVHHENDFGFGYSFTLGNGNDYVLEAAKLLVKQLDSIVVGDLISNEVGFYGTMTAINQIRWLSPWAGVPMMASGLIVNTILDWASKRAGLPAWEFLSRLETSELFSLMGQQHLAPSLRVAIESHLESSFPRIETRTAQLKETGLPVYFTTWIGQTASEVADAIWGQYESRGIKRFNLKVGPNTDEGFDRVRKIMELSPEDAIFSADANQSLDLETAEKWLVRLSDLDFKWLEEPFAPDNAPLFARLSTFRHEQGLSCLIASGENCPNTQTAVSLLQAGLDIFQADSCRMLGLVDNLTSSAIAMDYGAAFVPHAGGSGLDELATHTQLLNLARTQSELEPSLSLTEHIGFTSALFSNPTEVSSGVASTPSVPGLGVGLSEEMRDRVGNHTEGTLWVRF